ncbi:MAG TPA: hypothetical protein PLR74_08605 [Agriterribacter sp.]|nr:hypothetical protein [Agriterribacter sp.]
MKKLFIFFLCLYGIAAFSQECDKEALTKEPGKWLPQPGDEVHSGSRRPTAAEAAGAKKVFNQIGKMFQEKYKPVGADTYNYLTHNITSGNSSYGNWYIYTISNFRFLCINGKRVKNSEGVSSSVHINPPGSLTVSFNEMPIYNEQGEVSSETINNGGFHALSSKECKGGKLPDLSNGYHTVESGNDYYVWITYKGKLPYRYVSRKEFLEKQVALLEAQRKERKSGDSKEFLSSFFEKPLEAYRQDLKKDTAWLNKMTVVKSGTINDPVTKKHLYSRYVFTTLNDPFMLVPIMPNPDYYNRTLPKWAAQFILIEIRAAESFFGKNVRKVVDDNIEFFKTLLGEK